MRLAPDSKLHNFESMNGFALSAKYGMVVCGNHTDQWKDSRAVAVPLEGDEEWQVQWTNAGYFVGVPVVTDEILLEPRGSVRQGIPLPGSLVFTSAGAFVSVKRRLPSDPISVISLHDGYAGTVSLDHSLWTDSWSLYGYRKGVLVFEHHIDPSPKEAAES